MKRDSLLRFALPALALLLAGCDRKPARLAITDVRAVSTGTSAAVYFTIGNSGGADRLTSVEAPETGMAMLHDNMGEDGMMKMRGAPDGFEIPAGEGLILAPQGRHVMVMADQDIPLGEKMPIVLHFQHHRPMALAAPVEGPDVGE